ncbi:MAG: hypothetical protein EXR72_13370 [Myxococcales bacterium]|nr:hypothetical protein [Myxococcales bacterium]
MRIHFLGGYDAQSGTQTVYESASSSSGGTSWSAPVALSDATSQSHTTSDGVSSTFDPVSQKYLVTWRGGYTTGGGASHVHEIFYKAGASAPQRLLDANGNPYLASHTPSVACGPSAVVGTQNCLFAWVDGSSWYRQVRWFQASVSASGVLVGSSVKTHNYISTGSASVAYWSTGSYPWMIALNQGGTTSYTWRKAASSASAFVDQRSFSDSPKATTPALGSRVNGSARQAITLVGRE